MKTTKKIAKTLITTGRIFIVTSILLGVFALGLSIGYKQKDNFYLDKYVPEVKKAYKSHMIYIWNIGFCNGVKNQILREGYESKNLYNKDYINSNVNHYFKLDSIEMCYEIRAIK